MPGQNFLKYSVIMLVNCLAAGVEELASDLPYFSTTDPKLSIKFRLPPPPRFLSPSVESVPITEAGRPYCSARALILEVSIFRLGAERLGAAPEVTDWVLTP